MLFPLLVAFVAFLITFGTIDNISFRDRALHVEFELIATHADNFQVFFADKPGAFGRDDYVNRPVHASPRRQLLSFRMPQDTLFSYLRFDPATRRIPSSLNGCACDAATRWSSSMPVISHGCSRRMKR
ncbi:MAG: hypothetical protein H6594_09940 [Flavobacteriales bacterium]|nr:hypothetical protein [Flavobacteriales bacterium]